MNGAYYNEIDPYAAQWLRNLIAAGHIAPGDVDERGIAEVQADDLRGYRQCHFFAGIGIWSRALRLAGWPDDEPAWSGSCPCQPFSAAGHRRGLNDSRHCWPHWSRLIGECRPVPVFGEQVANNDGLAWLDFVLADLEGQGYTVGAVDTCAAGFGAPHVRQRLYFVATSSDSDKLRLQGQRQQAYWTWPIEQFEGLVQAELRLSIPSGKSGGVVDGASGRVGQLRAYGNALNAEAAAGFIEAYREAQP